MELTRLRVQDVDFNYRCIILRDSKDNKDRVVMLPEKLILPLQEILEGRKSLFEQDLANGVGGVFMPGA